MLNVHKNNIYRVTQIFDNFPTFLIFKNEFFWPHNGFVVKQSRCAWSADLQL